MVTALLIAYGKRRGVNIADGRPGSTHEGEWSLPEGHDACTSSLFWSFAVW